MTLEQVGVDRKLSMGAQRLAGIELSAFEHLISEVRDEMAERGGACRSDIAGELAKVQRDAERRTAYESRNRQRLHGRHSESARGKRRALRLDLW